MKKIGLFLGFLLTVIMLGGWSSFPPGGGLLSSSAAGEEAVTAAADVPKLTITNSTGTAFWMTVTGAKSYTFQVVPGKNVFEVEQGEYTLSYFACGAQQSQTVNVKKSGKSLKIVCVIPKAGKTPNLTVDNKSGGAVLITLTGSKYYSFTAPTGKNAFPIEAGTYTISYRACGALVTTTFTTNKKGWTLKLTCVSITIVNLSSGTLGLQLSGTANYYFSLPTGKTVITILPGTYTYTGSLSCGTNSGSYTFKKKNTLWWWGCYY